MADPTSIPYTPLNVLKPVDADLWVVDGPDIRFGYAGVAFPFPTRMTVIRLPTGDLWLHSPTEPRQDLVEAVSRLGPVRYLIAPNTLHYWWLPDWKDRFPTADVFAAPGLARAAKRPLPPMRDLGDRPPAAWAETIDQVLVGGDVLTEIDFFHRPTRTLILTDLIENFEPRRVRRWTHRLLLRLGGVLDPDGKAPLDMRLSFVRRREEVRAAAKRMIAWDPERIVLAHGRWYDREGTAELKRAFRWVL